MTPDTSKVICPACCHQFGAICVDDQRERSKAADEIERLTDLTMQGTALAVSLQFENARLRAALERIQHASRSSFTEYRQDCERMVSIAREALRGADETTAP